MSDGVKITLARAALFLSLALSAGGACAQVTQPGNGGTGLSSVPPHSVMFGNGAAPFSFATPPTKPGSVLTETGPNTDPVWGVARTILQSSTNLYVATNGIDAGNNCEVSSSPCLTPQRAWAQIAQKLDTNGQAITVNISPGTYPGFIASGPVIGTGAPPLFTATSPGSVTISGNVNNAIVVANGASIQISGLVLTATATSPQQSQGNDIVVFNGGVVYVGSNVTFSTCQSAHIYSANLGIVVLQNNYTISGSCPWHYYAVAGGQIFSSDQTLTVTLAGTPAFSNQFAKAWDLGFIEVSPITFVGSATGQQYSVILNGVIDAGGGCGSFPGNVGGMIGSGGQCN